MNSIRTIIAFSMFICVLFFTDIHSANALDQGNLLFYASFDKGVDADIAKGVPIPKKSGNVKLVPGLRKGRAAQFINRGDYLSYEVEKNINLPQGTICFWLRELDTTNKQRVMNPYFRMLGTTENFMIGRLWQPIKIVGGVWQNSKETVGPLACPVGSKNKWCHIAFSWRGHEAKIFFNGKRADICKADLKLLNNFKFFTLGRPKNPDAGVDSHHSGMHMWKDARSEAERMQIGKEIYGAFVIDDFMIFNRFLDESQITVIKDKPLSEVFLSKARGESKLVFDYYPNANRIWVDVWFGFPLPTEANILVEILDQNGEPTGVSANPSIIPSGIEYAKLDVSKLKLGKYTIAASAWDGDKCLERVRVPKQGFEKKAPEVWLNNTYGAEDVVLQGFEPLSVKGNTVVLWGRKYDLTDSIMPRSIINQGKEMLANPIVWNAKVQGKTVVLKTEEMKLVSSKDTRAKFEGIARLADLKVQANVMVEYDGFMKFDITFDPGNTPIKVDTLNMEIPFIPDQSTNFFYPCRSKGMWPKQWHCALTKLNETGVITVGTPDICLQWLTESDQYYYPKGYNRALETVTSKKKHIFRTNVIGEPTVIDKPFTLTFALQAGPVKAKPKNWRGWTMKGRKSLDPQKHTSVQYKYDWWARAPGEPIPRKGFPNKPDPELYKDCIRMCSTHFAGFQSYVETQAGKRTPEWQQHEAEWKRIPVLTYRMGTPGWNDIYVDTNSTWGQWHIENIYKLFKLTGMRGLYYDDWRPGVSMNELAGSGYVDRDGVRRPTYPIFSQREIHRRIYAIVHKFRPKDGVVIIHTSNSICLPIISFCDVIYDGEFMSWIQNNPLNGDYFDTYKDDLFQAALSCRQYGPVPALHDVTKKHAEREKSGPRILWMENQRKLWAKLLLHDIHTMGGFTSGAEQLLYIWMDYFGIADPQVVFHPYWESAPAVKVIKAYWEKDGRPEKTSDIKAVAYSKPDKTLIVVVVDSPTNYRGNIIVELKIDRKKLNLPLGELSCTDLELLDQAVELGQVDGNILKLPVGTNDFAAVILKKKLQK